VIRAGISILAFVEEDVASVRVVHFSHPSADLRVPF